MPRQLRIHLPGGFYHVTLRGNHRQNIFIAEGDQRLLNVIVARALDTFGARLHAYCWMTNHLHFLFQVGTEPLAGPMRTIASEFARAMQVKLETTGHFFERRYHATLVDVDTYLKALVRYIHLNPVEGGIVSSPALFPWSSHRAYLGVESFPWLTTDFVWSVFGATRAKAIAEYRRFMSAEDAAGVRGCFENGADRTSVLGSDEFVASVRRSLPPTPPKQSLEDLLTEACQRFGVSREQIQSPGRDRYMTQVRGWIANHARVRGIASLATVARTLGRHEATLRDAIRSYPSEVE